jgi:hypothetical protein
MLFVGRLWQARQGKIVWLTMGEMYELCQFLQGNDMFSAVKGIVSTGAHLQFLLSSWPYLMFDHISLFADLQI